MAYFNGQEYLLAALKGDSCFIRFSANADGSDFTETRQEGQGYIGIATGQTAPLNKEAYLWVEIAANTALQAAVKRHETRIGDLHTRIQGNARSYVLSDLSALSDLLRGRWNANNNGGFLESSALISGDNILIVQRDVPDFWFEATEHGTPETYTYTDAEGNETVYPLIVYEYAGEGEIPYRQLGLLHILESDYTVIEGYSKSASESAREAAANAEKVERLIDSHLEETDERFSSLEDRVHVAEYTLELHTRTLVFDTFEEFFHFIGMGEDTFVSGVQTSTKEMNHGDVVRILEDGVSDFWFERNESDPPRLLYNYNGKNYQMYVCSYAGMTVYGVMHPIRSCADVALGEIDTALDAILAIQESLIGGDAE